MDTVYLNLAFEYTLDSIGSESFIPANDPEWADEWGTVPEGPNWGLEAIHAPEMWDVGDLWQKNTDVVNVGVIDNQFCSLHEDLKFTELFHNSYDAK